MLEHDQHVLSLRLVAMLAIMHKLIRRVLKFNLSKGDSRLGCCKGTLLRTTLCFAKRGIVSPVTKHIRRTCDSLHMQSYMVESLSHS